MKMVNSVIHQLILSEKLTAVEFEFFDSKEFQKHLVPPVGILEVALEFRLILRETFFGLIFKLQVNRIHIYSYR